MTDKPNVYEVHDWMVRTRAASMCADMVACNGEELGVHGLDATLLLDT